MCRLLVIAAFVTFVTYVHGGRVTGRIVGGQPATIEDYPYTLSLEWKGNHACGAAVIHPKFALTAAHCTANVNKEDLAIREGSSIRNEGGFVFAIKNVFIHPNNRIFDYDFSILEVLEPVLTLHGQAIPLPGLRQPYLVGDSATATGWGARQSGGENSDMLQEVTVKLVDFSACKEIFGTALTERMMCAGIPEGGKDACSGDSGGPLVVKGTLVGVVSWGRGCAQPGIPGVYANVALVRDWIMDVTGY